MIDLLKRPIALYCIAALLLTGILTSMVAARISHLKNGREIVLNIRPVDPRDLFKGDYVRLGFDITQPILPAGRADDMKGRVGKRVFVLLEPGASEGDWKVVSVTGAAPTAAANQIVLRAQATNGWFFYGIERYYVPEGTGPKLEGQARSGKLAAIVSVNAKGEAAIKGLKLDGKTIHVEPLL